MRRKSTLTDFLSTTVMKYTLTTVGGRTGIEVQSFILVQECKRQRQGVMASVNGEDIPMEGKDAGLELRKLLQKGLESKNGCR